MLCYPSCAVPEELCYHLQAYPSVQAPGSIGVSGNVGEDRFINATEVSDGFQIDIEFMIPDDREFEMIFFENLHPLLQDDSGIEHPSLVALVVYVVLTILRYLEVCGAYLRTKYSFQWQLSLKLRIFKDKVQFPAALVLETPHFQGQSTVSCGSCP